MRVMQGVACRRGIGNVFGGGWVAPHTHSWCLGHHDQPTVKTIQAPAEEICNQTTCHWTTCLIYYRYTFVPVGTHNATKTKSGPQQGIYTYVFVCTCANV